MRAGVLLLAAALGGCLYLDTINVAPVARIQVLTGTVHVGGTVALSAQTSEDEDTSSLRYDWTVTPCRGAGCVDLRDDRAVFEVPVSRHDTLHVSLTVVDKHGAPSVADERDITVTDVAPTVLLQPQGDLNPDNTYTVSKAIVFRAMGSDADGDKLTYAFDVHPPPASDPGALVKTRLDDTSLQVIPDAPGHYEIVVTADDGYGMTGTAHLDVNISADAPPCIAATSPTWSPDTRVILWSGDGPRRFAVETVTDDLDSYPGSGIDFRWFVAVNGGARFEVDGHDLPALAVDPDAYQPGDELDVRVEISDRVDRTLPCAADQAACSITGNQCFQRLTWTAEVR